MVMLIHKYSLQITTCDKNLFSWHLIFKYNISLAEKIIYVKLYVYTAVQLLVFLHSVFYYCIAVDRLLVYDNN